VICLSVILRHLPEVNQRDQGKMSLIICAPTKIRIMYLLLTEQIYTKCEPENCSEKCLISSQVGLKLDGTRQLLDYADDVNLLGDNIVTVASLLKARTVEVEKLPLLSNDPYTHSRRAPHIHCYVTQQYV
jgi:hypothetical protein